jgi:type VI secretion system ImpM family protein
MSCDPGAPFLFGKLPAHGDFVSRGLTPAQVEAWDAWATAALEALRATSQMFEQAHDEAPPWRFIAGPSRLGSGWRAGALAPSIDAAGRRFFLVLGVQGADPAFAAGCGMPFAEKAEGTLYRALGERLTADETLAAVGEASAALAEPASIAAILSAAPAGTGAWWVAQAGAPPRAGAEPATDLFAAAADAWAEAAP